MAKLIDIARSLKRGWKIKITWYQWNIPKQDWKFSKPLTDAQIIAYQDKTVVTADPSMDEKTMYCAIADGTAEDGTTGTAKA